MSQDQYEHALRAYLTPDAATEGIAKSVIDASFAVHQELGPGYAESIYEEALAIELAARRVSFARQAVVPTTYRDSIIGEHRLDLFVAERLVVEIKALEGHCGSVQIAQVLSYLKASGTHLGLLINFGLPTLKAGLRRVVSRTYASP